MISFLKENSDIALGYCSLNIDKTENPVLYDKGKLSIRNMAYLSKHPSGNFYKNEPFKKLDTYNRKNDYYVDSGFFFEFINAEMCMFGRSVKSICQLSILKLKKRLLKKFLTHIQKMMFFSYLINNMNYLNIMPGIYVHYQLGARINKNWLEVHLYQSLQVQR